MYMEIYHHKPKSNIMEDISFQKVSSSFFEENIENRNFISLREGNVLLKIEETKKKKLSHKATGIYLKFIVFFIVQFVNSVMHIFLLCYRNAFVLSSVK